MQDAGCVTADAAGTLGRTSRRTYVCLFFTFYLAIKPWVNFILLSTSTPSTVIELSISLSISNLLSASKSINIWYLQLKIMAYITVFNLKVTNIWLFLKISLQLNITALSADSFKIISGYTMLCTSEII